MKERLLILTILCENISIGHILIAILAEADLSHGHCDPPTLDFYQWRHMKSMVCETSVTSEMYLIARMAEAAGDP